MCPKTLRTFYSAQPRFSRNPCRSWRSNTARKFLPPIKLSTFENSQRARTSVDLREHRPWFESNPSRIGQHLQGRSTGICCMAKLNFYLWEKSRVRSRSPQTLEAGELCKGGSCRFQPSCCLRGLWSDDSVSLSFIGVSRRTSLFPGGFCCLLKSSASRKSSS